MNPVVLCLPPISSSLDAIHRPLELIDGRPLLGWWRRRLEAFGVTSVFILCPSAVQAERIDGLGLPGTDCVVTRFSSQTAAVAELCAIRQLSGIALVTLATALGPRELLSELSREQEDNQAAACWMSDLPGGVTPWILSSEVLGYLAGLRQAGLSSHPGVSLTRLLESGQTVPFSILQAPLPTKYRVDAWVLPSQIGVSSQEEVDIFRRVAKELPEPTGIEGLARWKTEEIQLRLEARQKPRRARRSRPRVLFVSNAAGYSGAEESLVQLAGKIDPRRFEVVAAVGMAGHLERRLGAAGIAVRAFPDGFRETTLANFRTAKELVEFYRPDIIHANSLEGYPLLWQAVEQGIPLVQHVRNGDMRGFREPVENAASIIAVSHYLRRRALRFAVPPERVQVVYDEVDEEWFLPGAYNKAAMRKKFEIPREAPVILMIARFVANKRHDLMLEAFQRIRNEHPSAVLVLKGESFVSNPIVDQLQRYVTVHGMQESVRQIGFVDDIRELYAAADLLVLCSDDEGLGRCVVEAMSMALPVVVTDSGGTHEIVADHEQGRVVRGGDAPALASAVSGLLGDQEMCQRMGLSGRARVKAELSSEHSASQVMGIYEKLADPSALTHRATA